jgi:acyl-CoA dehydrogenase
VPEEYSGGGQGLLEMGVAVETLSLSGAGAAASFVYLLTPAFGALTIARHGTDQQKRDLLLGLATGEIETCFAITEPDAGSNAINISTHARRDGADFVVSGQKIWISGVERADHMMLVTRTIPAADARPRVNGFTILLVDVKDAVAKGTLTYRPIPKLGTNTVASNMVFPKIVLSGVSRSGCPRTTGCG